MSFTVEIPRTFALDRSLRKAGNVEVVTELGVVVTELGVVVTELGVLATERIQDEPEFATNEMFGLQALKPFRFLARTRTLYVFPAPTAFTVHLATLRLAVQVFVPTFTCVCRIGDFAFVLAIEKLTVTSTEPFEDFAVL